MSLGLEDARAGRKLGVHRFTDAEKCARWRLKHPKKVTDYRARPNVKEMHRVKQAAWQTQNPEKTAAIYRQWYVGRDVVKRLLHNAERRARTCNFDFDIDETDLLPLPTHCPVLGIELDYGAGVGTNPRDPDKGKYASLDRKDNTLGYVKGNVFVISWKANQLKSNGTADEHEAIASWMKRVAR